MQSLTVAAGSFQYALQVVVLAVKTHIARLVRDNSGVCQQETDFVKLSLQTVYAF